MTELPDEELVASYRLAGGSPHGDRFLNELFRRHHRRVGLWCLRITGDRESAADFAQDVFLKAYRNLDSFRGDSRFSTWLYSIARNHCLNELASRASRPAETIQPELADLADETARDPLRELEERDRYAVFQRLMRESLTEVECQVMTLHYADELPLDAITRLLKLDNASGAKAYIVSAKRKLAAAVERWRARASNL